MPCTYILQLKSTINNPQQQHNEHAASCTSATSTNTAALFILGSTSEQADCRTTPLPASAYSPVPHRTLAAIPPFNSSSFVPPQSRPAPSGLVSRMAVGEKLRIAGVVALYFAVSITLVFANKILMPSGLAKKEHDIDAPLFVTWFQCVLTAAIIYALGWFAQGAAPDSWLKEFPKGTLAVDTLSHSLTRSSTTAAVGGETARLRTASCSSARGDVAVH